VQNVWDEYVTKDEGLEDDESGQKRNTFGNVQPKDSNCGTSSSMSEQAYTFDPAGHAADDPMDFFYTSCHAQALRTDQPVSFSLY